jgi:hypothetical protein
VGRTSRLLVALLGAVALAGPAGAGSAAAAPATHVPSGSAPVAAAATSRPASQAAARLAGAGGVEPVGPARGAPSAHLGGLHAQGTRTLADNARAIVAAAKSQGARPASAGHSMSGRVVARPGDPISGIGVFICAGICVSQSVADTLTDVSGNWTVAVPDGWYTIEFVDNDNIYAVGVYTAAGINYNFNAADRVQVAGADVSGLNVTMPEFRTIAGRVRTAAGANLNNIQILSEIDSAPFWSAVTSADGTFTLPAAPGAVTLKVTDTVGAYVGGWWTNPSVSPFSADAVSIAITDTDVANVNVTLAAGLKIKGKVVAASGGAIGGIYVDAYLGSEAVSGTYSGTNPDGTFSLAVGPGSYTIRISDDYYGHYGPGWRGSPALTLDQAQAGLVTVETADVTGINVTMPAPRSIGGTVTDVFATPLPNMEVDFWHDGSWVGSTTTDSIGHYAMALEPGAYEVGFYDDTWTHPTGYWSQSGFQYWWANVGTIALATVNVTGVNVQLPPASVPGAPTAVAGAGFNNSAMVWWSHPANQGGLGSLAYDVVSTPGGFTCHSLVTLSCTVSGLTNGQHYTFKVTATNLLGAGSASDASAEITPAAVPDAPASVTGVGFDRSIAVTWPAAADNGAGVTGYTVTAWNGSDGHLGCTTSGALTCTVTGLANHTYYGITVYATNIRGDGPPAMTALDVAPRAGNSYVPLTPNRVLNTHTGLGGLGALTPYVAATFTVRDRVVGDPARNVPPEAVAVTGVLSVSDSGEKGYLALTSLPVDHPTTSTLNFPRGDARATGVTVPLSGTGTLSVTYAATTGTAHATFDVTGYFVEGTGAMTYVALAPNRILDSRPAYHNGLGASLTAGTHGTFAVVRRIRTDVTKNVPSGAVAVTGTLTVTSQTAPGYLTLGPETLDSPTTASLYFPRGDNRANGLTVKLGPGGTLNVVFTSTTAGAKADVIFDVNGYFIAGQSGAMFEPVVPNRILDTRKPLPLGQFKPIHPYAAATFQVTGRASGDQTMNVPAGAVAVTGILTVTNQTASGWLALTKTPINRPTTSTLNFLKGDNRATGVTVPLSLAGKLSVTYGGASPSTMTTSVIFDVSGYFVS